MSDLASTDGATNRGRGGRKGARQREMRVAYAIERLAQAESYRQICAALQARFKVSPRTAERDVGRAYKRVGAALQAEMPHLRGRLADRYLRLSRAAERRKDFASAIRACDSLAKLCGLVAPTKVEVAGPDPEREGVLGLTPAERERRLAELIAKRVDAGAAPPAPAATEPGQSRRPSPFSPADRARGRR
jgi:hypothetical protein